MPILLIKKSSNAPTPDPAGRWKAGEVVNAFADGHQFSPREEVDYGNFYHVSVTDKTFEEVRAYLQSWNHEPTIEQVSRQGNRRLIEVVSTMVSATGKNAFVQADIEALLVEIGGTYDSHTQTSFRFEITASVDKRDEIMETIRDAIANTQYARRRWYINQTGMDYLAANGGSVSGTAAQVAGYLRDGLLD